MLLLLPHAQEARLLPTEEHGDTCVLVPWIPLRRTRKVLLARTCTIKG